MKRAALVAFLSLVLALCPAAAVRAGSITYEIVNYTSLQSGWTLSGTITTDGTLGILGNQNILSWAFTASNGVSSLIGSSLAGSFDEVGLTATATQLLLPGPTALQFDTYVDFEILPSTELLVYFRPGAELTSLGFEETYGASDAWSTNPSSPGGLLLGGDPWVVASNGSPSGAPCGPPSSTPEPACVTLLGIGIAGMAGYRWCHRQKVANQ